MKAIYRILEDYHGLRNGESEDNTAARDRMVVLARQEIIDAEINRKALIEIRKALASIPAMEIGKRK